jgi:hypothetical protein
VRRSDCFGLRPLLLNFASITDPMAASAGRVLRRLWRDFADEVVFLTVYVREAHPGHRIPQPRTFDWKMRHARMYRERDAIAWTVAVDDLEGRSHRAYGGNSNAAFLVDRRGNVAFRTLWSNDEKVLRQALQAITAGRLGTPFERERRLVSLVGGLGHVDQVVRAAGADALEDVRRETPLIFAVAEVAWLWRVLTPLGRAALVASVAAGVGAVAGVLAFTRRSRGR